MSFSIDYIMDNSNRALSADDRLLATARSILEQLQGPSGRNGLSLSSVLPRERPSPSTTASLEPRRPIAHQRPDDLGAAKVPRLDLCPEPRRITVDARPQASFRQGPEGPFYSALPAPAKAAELSTPASWRAAAAEASRPPSAPGAEAFRLPAPCAEAPRLPAPGAKASKPPAPGAKAVPKPRASGISRELQALGVTTAKISNGGIVTKIDSTTWPDIKALLEGGISDTIARTTNFYTYFIDTDLVSFNRAIAPLEGCEFLLYGYTIYTDDMNSLSPGGWLTGAILNSLFIYMAEVHRGPQAPVVHSSASFTNADIVHVIGDGVMLVTTDYFSSYNPAFAVPQDDIVGAMTRTLTNLFNSAIEAMAIEGTKILIPYSYLNNHWYLMCLVFGQNPKLIIINSIRHSTNTELSEIIAQCVVTVNKTNGIPTTECPIIHLRGLEQVDGFNCGIFTAHAVVCIQPNPSIIDLMTPDGKIPKECILATSFNLNRFRTNLKWLILDRVFHRVEKERADASESAPGGKPYDADKADEARADAIRAFMRDGNKLHLIRGLNEDNFSAFTLSEGPGTDGIIPLAKAQLEYYRLGGAPYCVLFYANLVPTLSDSPTAKQYYLADLLKMDPEGDENDLEHKFIQEAFSLPYPSKHNTAAKLLCQKGAEILKYSQMLSQRHELAIQRLILQSIGLGSDDIHSRRPLVVRKPRLFAARVLKDTHYRLRITRWLLHLRLTGYEALAHSLYHLLMHYVHIGQMQNYSDVNAREWETAMTATYW